MFRSMLASSPGTAVRAVPLMVLALALVGSGCGKEETQGRPGQAQAAQKKAQVAQKRGGGPARAKRGGDGFRGNGEREAAPAVPVAVQVVARGPIASYITATATLEAEKEAEILARTSGIVLRIQAEEGDRVQRGATLLSIEDDEVRLRLSQAKAEAAKQQARFARIEQMHQGNLVSAEEFDIAKNDLQAARAAEDLARLELSYTRVTAPFAGHVVARLVDPGQTVNVGTPLFRLVDMEPLLAKVFIPAREFRSIQPDQPVELTLDSTGDAMAGRITLVSPVVDPTSGTIKVTVEIQQYPPRTRPGDFAEVRIVTESHPDALLVPKIAVLSERGDEIVFVATADSTAERRVVATGFQDRVHSEILTGVQEGETVVIQGQRSLKHGQALRILEPVQFEEAGS